MNNNYEVDIIFSSDTYAEDNKEMLGFTEKYINGKLSDEEGKWTSEKRINCMRLPKDNISLFKGKKVKAVIDIDKTTDKENIYILKISKEY